MRQVNFRAMAKREKTPRKGKTTSAIAVLRYILKCSCLKIIISIARWWKDGQERRRQQRGEAKNELVARREPLCLHDDVIYCMWVYKLS